MLYCIVNEDRCADRGATGSSALHGGCGSTGGQGGQQGSSLRRGDISQVRRFRVIGLRSRIRQE